MIKPWPKLSSTPRGDFRIFKVRSDVKVSPRTGMQMDLFVIECVNWVNVVAVTPDDQLVLIEQFRHGSETIELEVPGGIMDPGEADPLVTGVRELREETGYEGDEARIIGHVLPNPAIQNNVSHTVLVRNCRLKHAVQLDHGEDIVARLVPLSEVPALVAAGKIRHGIVVAALYQYELWRRCGQAGA